MRLESILYRFRQFWQAIYAVPSPEDLSLATTVLNPDQLNLFARLQRSEQAHSLLVFKKLYAQCQQDPIEFQADLLAAALLHDVGKSCYPLSLWERVLIVLANVVFPDRIRGWGGTPKINCEDYSGGSSGWRELGWRRPFVIAEQHPRWGAEMVEKAGSSQLTVALICRHQDAPQLPAKTNEDCLLFWLQSADGRY